jgi:[histone H3]-lysine36 N-trimethyltransferase
VRIHPIRREATAVLTHINIQASTEEPKVWNEPVEGDRPVKRRRSLSPPPSFIILPPTRVPTVFEPIPRPFLDLTGIQEEEKRRAQAQVANILAKAAADAEAAAIAGPAKPVPKKEEVAAKKASKPKLTAEEKEAAKDKQLQKLVSPVVVKCLSKYKDKMDHETFKKHAKEVRDPTRNW